MIDELETKVRAFAFKKITESFESFAEEFPDNPEYLSVYMHEIITGACSLAVVDSKYKIKNIHTREEIMDLFLDACSIIIKRARKNIDNFEPEENQNEKV